jgi:serine/threonine protein kinase
MQNSLSVINYKNNIIKYSSNNIIFFYNSVVFKQFSFDKFKWVDEVLIVNKLNHKNIIKFINCEILDDYIIDDNTKEFCLDKKEKVLRITMHKYITTLDKLTDINTDEDVFFIMNNILIAIINCQNNNVLHRDIKEKNIFINYKYINTKRVLQEIVLADFNISKLCVIPDKKSKIMTISHRSPEILLAINNNIKITYDHRVDVWSFIIVLSFIITGKSFYSFIRDSYLILDPGILSNNKKIIIVMKHFMKIYKNTNLKYNNLYKKIILSGLKNYNDRPTFNNIYNMINNYIIKNKLSYKLDKIDIIINSPKLILNDILIKNSRLIENLHKKLQYHDIVIKTYYKFYIKMIKNNFNFDNEYLIALYIISTLIMLDTLKSIEFYILYIQNIFLESQSEQIINNVSNVFLEKKREKKQNQDKKHSKHSRQHSSFKITSKIIENKIIDILQFNKYNMF